jgi:hypothetical protein
MPPCYERWVVRESEEARRGFSISFSSEELFHKRPFLATHGSAFLD